MAGSSDKKWYIITLCKTHNAMTGETITVGDYVKLVSADKAETCG
jgi:hypothetical protein